jgi:multiple sugar transport system ATP-binding protein
MRVRFEGVAKRFGAHHALRDLTLEVPSGECMVLLGPSGCGKTTLLRLLAGLETADAGRILIGDRVVNDVPAPDRDVAMVFQNYALYPHFTVFDNIAFPLRARRRKAAEIAPRVQEAARRLGLEALLERRPAQLSGGQQQRVALARAIVRNPVVYLMDEPLSNLDAQLRVQTRTELKRLQQELGTTTLYVTHDQAEAMTMGTRIALLQAGVVEQVGAPLELYRRPATRFVASFLGSPAMNLWPGEHEGGMARVTGSELRLPAGAARLPPAAQAFTIGVRPEDVTLAAAPSPEATRAEVLVVEPMGNETIVTLQAGTARVVARAAADVSLRAGDTAFVALPADRVHFFDEPGGRRLG